MPQNKPCIIAIASDKGGVGKTTTASSLAYLLNTLNKKVLVIDSDPQGNMSSKFGFNPYERHDNYIGDLLDNLLNKTPFNIAQFIKVNPKYKNLNIIISDQRLDAIYDKFDANNTFIFQDLINIITDNYYYDYIIIDTRPALKAEVGAAFIASDYVLIPTLASIDSIMGANDILDFVNVCQTQNQMLKILGIFFNRTSERTKAYKEIKPFVKESWDNYLFNTAIPQNQDVVNAENSGMSVTEAFPTAKASKAFEDLLLEVISRVERDKTYNS